MRSSWVRLCVSAHIKPSRKHSFWKLLNFGGVYSFFRRFFVPGEGWLGALRSLWPLAMFSGINVKQDFWSLSAKIVIDTFLRWVVPSSRRISVIEFLCQFLGCSGRGTLYNFYLVRCKTAFFCFRRNIVWVFLDCSRNTNADEEHRLLFRKVQIFSSTVLCVLISLTYLDCSYLHSFSDTSCIIDLVFLLVKRLSCVWLWDSAHTKPTCRPHFWTFA